MSFVSHFQGHNCSAWFNLKLTSPIKSMVRDHCVYCRLYMTPNKIHYTDIIVQLLPPLWCSSCSFIQIDLHPSSHSRSVLVPQPESGHRGMLICWTTLKTYNYPRKELNMILSCALFFCLIQCTICITVPNSVSIFYQRQN